MRLCNATKEKILFKSQTIAKKQGVIFVAANDGTLSWKAHRVVQVCGPLEAQSVASTIALRNHAFLFLLLAFCNMTIMYCTLSSQYEAINFLGSLSCFSGRRAPETPSDHDGNSSFTERTGLQANSKQFLV